ncbi:hypothetical protein SEVIR_2G339566v4 [Setaria viridis]|uniref:Uncharacterized protein n=1 Tax=Setaria viridis TaxID=4556 RepID=A0A4U6W2Z4_SETVI|nr:hypothetical protein SEVIR_2G339566v2 [Setaria viridis]
MATRNTAAVLLLVVVAQLAFGVPFCPLKVPNAKLNLDTSPGDKINLDTSHVGIAGNDIHGSNAGGVGSGSLCTSNDGEIVVDSGDSRVLGTGFHVDAP